MLMNRGCKRIGTIAGPADMTAGVDRLDGWRAAMRDAGIAPDAIAYGDFTEAGGDRAINLLRSTPTSTGSSSPPT